MSYDGPDPENDPRRIVRTASYPCPDCRQALRLHIDAKNEAVVPAHGHRNACPMVGRRVSFNPPPPPIFETMPPKPIEE